MNFFEWGYAQWFVWSAACAIIGAVVGIAVDRLYHGDRIAIGRLHVMWTWPDPIDPAHAIDVNNPPTDMDTIRRI